jgi:hypothetical protein
MMRLGLRVVGALALVLCGCAGPIVYGTAPTIRTDAFRARVAYRPLDVSSSIAVQATAGLGSGGVTAFDANGARAGAIGATLAQGLRTLFAAAPEEEAMTNGPGAGDLLARFTLDDYVEEEHRQDGAMVACTIFGSITVGLGYLPCAGLRHDTEHVARFTLRLWFVRGVPVVQVTRRGEPARSWDTSSLAPFLTRSYEVRVRSGVGAWGAPSTTELEEHTRRQGDRLARELLARAGPEIEAALRRVPAAEEEPRPRPARQVVAPAPSDESTATWSSAVRGLLDARRAVVLVCTNDAPVAIRASWDGSGGVLRVEVATAVSDAVRGCIVSAIGSITVPPGTPSGTLLHPLGP